MNRNPKHPHLFHLALFSGAIATTATLSLFIPGVTNSVRAALQESPKAILDEAWQIVNREYVDATFNQTDWQAARQRLLSRDYSSREQAYDALRKELELLNDPYTRFMDREQYQSLSNQTSGELSGVGMRLEIDEETKKLIVVEPIEGSPALKAGIKTGDEILEINGKSTEGIAVEAAAAMIRGEEGTKVDLKLARDGQAPFDVSLTRARIELPTVRYTLNREGGRAIGYIRLNQFSGHASQQMRRAIQDLKQQNAEAFVLDLRGNPGGLLNASIDIARMWLDQGGIVKTVNRVGQSENISANNSALTQLPLTVLVDGNSASSSEILTGALQDNDRATVVGSKTFGKALVQSVHALSDGSGVAVTIAHYYTPSGTDISQKGITPDIQIELSEVQQQQLSSNPKLIGTMNDPQYAKAIDNLMATALRQDAKSPQRASLR